MSLAQVAHKTIEVLRPGVFTPTAGVPVRFNETDLQNLADAYDGESAPAPAVVGHPALDAPAYAWAKNFAYDKISKRLTATLRDIEPQFSGAVSQGRYKKISLALFAPDAPNNPKPGVWYPKHIGFLGAAAPAVPGLKPVSFGEGQGGALTFELGASDFLDAVGERKTSLFQTLRARVEHLGAPLERTPLRPPVCWLNDLSSARGDASSARGDLSSAPRLAGDDKTIQAREAALFARETALKERERAISHADHVAFAEGLIENGRLTPSLKAKVVALLDGFSPVGGRALEVSFCEGDDVLSYDAVALTKQIFSALPKIVTFGESVPANHLAAGADFALPEGARADPASAALHGRALAYAAAHPGVDYIAAATAAQS